jgi:hypothetical protein
VELWFSAKRRIAALVEPRGVVRFMDCVHVFRALDWATAFESAVALGRTHESEFTNADGANAKWRLAQLVTLDLLEGETLDGCEVYSEFVSAGDADIVGWDHAFHPEGSTPTQSI